MPDVTIYALDESATIDEGFFDIAADDYVATVVQLLPEGKWWNWKPGGVFERLIGAVSYEAARIERRVRDLIEETDPRTADEMLVDWERNYNIQGQCEEDQPTTLEGRRLRLHGKVSAKIGETGEAFFLAMAARLGYPDAEIVRSADPFLCTSECTHALYGFEGGWLFHWTLVANDTTENDGVLQCLVLQHKKQRDYVSFDFT